MIDFGGFHAIFKLKYVIIEEARSNETQRYDENFITCLDKIQTEMHNK